MTSGEIGPQRAFWALDGDSAGLWKLPELRKTLGSAFPAAPWKTLRVSHSSHRPYAHDEINPAGTLKISGPDIGGRSNDHLDDFAQYYDEETFEAVRALSPRPGWDDPIAWDFAIQERGEEIWRLLTEPTTFVFVAGLEKVRVELDRVFARLAGSLEAWLQRKTELEAERRWVELLY